MKKLMLGTALSSLMVVAALAQSPSGSSGSSPAPSATPSATSSSGSASSSSFISSQKPDQFVATKFKGTDVIGSDDQKIGTISDILFDKDGKIDAYVVAVGGFLGVGAKEVAMPPSAFTVQKGDASSSDKLKVSATKDQLKEAQNFERYQPPRPTATTGAGGGMGGGMGSSRPMGAPPAGR